MNKFLVIFIGSLVFVVLVALVLLGLGISMAGPHDPEKTDDSAQQQKPAENIETVDVFGVKMQKRCNLAYEDFLKSYGGDYKKCLNSFSFDEKYCGGFDPEKQGMADVNMIVILDSSGSMAEKIDITYNSSGVRIDVAKKAVSDFLVKMPSGVNTGLVVYGHRGSNSAVDKDASCKGIEEVVKLGQNNESNILSALNVFRPSGWTPIAGAIDLAKEIFTKKGSKDKDYLVLVSDGEESCGGDALKAAQDLRAEIPNINFTVIGFATNEAARSSLEKIAQLSKGYYMTALNAEQISKAFNNQLMLIKRDCLSATIYKMYAGINSNSQTNLNCWLDMYNKEMEDFKNNILVKSHTPEEFECNAEIAGALKARHTDFWRQKQQIEEKNTDEYQKIEFDLKKQIEAIGAQISGY